MPARQPSQVWHGIVSGMCGAHDSTAPQLHVMMRVLGRYTRYTCACCEHSRSMEASPEMYFYHVVSINDTTQAKVD